MALVLKVCLYAAVSGLLFGQSVMDWQQTTDLPGVDFSGLTAGQKNAALRIMRALDCTCGCGMKVAECRIKDPACGFSTGVAALVVKGLREGKTADQIAASIASSQFAQRKPPPVLEAPVAIPIEGAPVRGPERARVTVVEFSDFECPYCAKATAEVAKVMQAFPNDIRLVYKQFPLSMHPHAKLAATAALAANAQGKFWPMHDALFAHHHQLTLEHIVAWARELGLDMPRFTSEISANRYESTITKDLRDGDEAHVEGTPAFFINGKKLNAPFELSVVKPIIEAELRSTASSDKQAALR